MPFFLAIDNGGTKADYVLADEHRELARVRTGTLKRMRTDAVSALANLEAGLLEIAARSGVPMHAIDCTCVGTAGETVPLVTEWLTGAITARVPGDFILVGDVEIALDAAFRCGPGVLVLAGTGSNVAARAPDGRILRAGGWGPAVADQGSGHRIGQQAVRAGFLAIDEGRETRLLGEIIDFWDLCDVADLIAFANLVPAPDFSRLTELVVRCATKGDKIAAEVLRQEGEDLGYLVRLLLRRMFPGGGNEDAGTIQLAFAGSIMENVAPVREALIAAVQRDFPLVQPVAGVVDPVDGALWRARRGLK